MNNSWQNRILNHTETPPEGAWEKIAGELIAAEKNNNTSFAKKMTEYEAEPPAMVWEKINSALNVDNVSSDLSKKMLQYQEIPPATVWERISEALGKARVISMKPGNSIYRKIAIAASIMLVVGTAAWYLLNKNSTGSNDSVVAVNTTPANKTVENTTTDKINKTEEVKTDATVNSNTASNVAKVKSLVATDTFNYATNGTEEIALAEKPLLNKEKLLNNQGVEPTDIDLVNTPNTYVTITGPDGQSIKVSSKFSSIAGLFNDTGDVENIDVVIKESGIWRARFAAWRTKMLNSIAAPSFTNFMDIIELNETIKEKK